MATISIKGLTFAYPGQDPLFNHCNLDLDTDWKLDLLGRNGRGKTTLMKILQQQINYQGTINGQFIPRYFPLTVNESAALAGDAVIAAGPDSSIEAWQLERELNLMHTDPAILWQPYSTLSGGEQTKLQLAALFANDRYYLLLDEPTNHLDQASRQQVADYLRQKQTGFIITSHDRDFLDQVIDHSLVIEQHQLILEHGNYSTYFTQKKRRDEAAQASNQQLKKDIKSLKRSQQQRQQWAQRAEGEKKNNAHADKGFIGAKAAKMMQKSTNLQHRIGKAIGEKQGLLQNVESVVPLTLNVQPTHHQQLLALKEIRLSYPGKQLCQALSFTVKQGEQVALTGRNGCGKSSLVQAILGQFPGKLDGQIELAHDLKLSLVRQDYTSNHGTLKEFTKDNQLEYDRFLNILFKLGMPRATFNNRIEQMSMGQQKKVELARSLVTPAQLYIWDEPLNYLDTYNQEQLITLLHEYRPPLLFIEHDRHFIKAVANKVVNLAK